MVAIFTIIWLGGEGHGHGHGLRCIGGVVVMVVSSVSHCGGDM